MTSEDPLVQQLKKDLPILQHFFQPPSFDSISGVPLACEDESPVKVTIDELDPHRGRFVVASRCIDGGRLIHTASPFASAPFDTKFKSVCAYCLKSKRDEYPVSCDECESMQYCSGICKTVDDKNVHNSIECRTLKKLYKDENWKTKFENDFDAHTRTLVRLVLRFICRGIKNYLQDKQHSHIINDNNNTEFQFHFNHITFLTPNYGNLERKQDRLDVFKAIAKFLLDVLSTDEDWKPLELFNMDIFQNNGDGIILLLCRIECNSFGIFNLQDDICALAVYPSISLTNHSCQPNVCLKQRGNQLDMISIRDIPEGQEINISYVNLYMDSEERKKKLNTDWMFTCQCNTCLDPYDEEIGTMITAISSEIRSDYLASGFRPPAVPLIVFDGYNNIWSMADNLYDDWPRLWDGTVKALAGMIRIDSHVYRFMGPKDIGVDEVIPQVAVQVYPTQTVYTFGNSMIDLTVTFTTPTIPTDLDKLSYPVTFITFKVQVKDAKKHSIQIYYDNTGELCVNDPNEEITWDRGSIGSSQVLRMGTADQQVLGQSGDRIGINWGHVYITQKNSVFLDWYQGNSHQVITGSLAARNQFISQGTIPQTDDTNKPRAASNNWPVIACTWNFTLSTLGSIENSILYMYDDIYSIKYFGTNMEPYWRRNHLSHSVTDPKPAYELIKLVLAEHETIVKDCNAVDEKVMQDLTNIGGLHYSTLGSLVFRQSFGACKLVWNADKKVPWYFLKEISSNGDLSTVDVIFPAAPIFLYQSPTLLTYLLEPLFAYANNETTIHYDLAWAPHHLGTYPIANIYPDQQEQMPIEETANLLLMVAAIAQSSDSIDLLIPKYWHIMQSWAEYLVTVLPNPENQLCTDDFEGPSPENVNLAAKGILGLSSFAYLCEKYGYDDLALNYQTIAANYTTYWTSNAYDGDHYMKQFNVSGSWSLKYNILFQDFLGLTTFPQFVIRTELNYYLNSHMNTYGVPLDGGATFTKLDWLTWVAAMAAKEGREEDWNELIDVAFKFANETPDRVPLTDWYDTISGRQTGFQARPVLGGMYARLIL